MNVKGKFRGMTLLTELKKRGSISKIDFEKVSWYLENLDDVDYQLDNLKFNLQACEEKNNVLQEQINKLDFHHQLRINSYVTEQTKLREVIETNKSMYENEKEENQKLAKELSELDERNQVLSDNIQICSQQLEASTTNRNFWIAIAFLSAVVSIGLIVKEFFV